MLLKSVTRIQAETKTELTTEKEKLLKATSMISGLETKIESNKLESENVALIKAKELNDGFAKKIAEFHAIMLERTDSLREDLDK
jgi:hypothetical protein